MNPILTNLGILIGLATLLGLIARLLRQPLLLAYLATGILVSFLGLLDPGHQEILKTFSDLGIMFLLFLVGLEINYSSLRLVGRASLIVGLGQIIFTFIIGFFIATLFGFSAVSAAYISIALTFSSTVIIVKLLSDKRDLNSLYGKISVGLLLVQDFVAILLLIFLAGIQSGSESTMASLLLTIVKGTFLFIMMVLLSKSLLPSVVDIIGTSQELLFVASLAWVFFLVALVQSIGFSVEIAGFLAGLSLANSTQHYEIASHLKPLRDFFIIIFFIVLGSLVVVTDLSALSLPILTFSLFVLIGNPLIMLIIMGLMGYRKRTSFFAGITVAQISEFSLVLAVLGLKLGHISQQDTAIIAATGVITIGGSTYLIMYAQQLFEWLSPYLGVFERDQSIEQKQTSIPAKKIILIGYHRTGQSIASHLQNDGLLVIDFDPDSIALLQQQHLDYLFDDINDPDIVNYINFDKAKLVISTSPELSVNLALLAKTRRLKEEHRTFKVITRARTTDELKILYEQGADYVLLPHFTAGHHLGKLVHADPSGKTLQKLKEKDLALLPNKMA